MIFHYIDTNKHIHVILFHNNSRDIVVIYFYYSSDCIQNLFQDKPHGTYIQICQQF
jgi:hypothetical protein